MAAVSRLIALVLLAWSASAQAFTITTEYRYTNWGGTTYHVSASAACTFAYNAAHAANAPVGGLKNLVFDGTTSSCTASYVDSGLGTISFNPVVSRSTCSGGGTYSGGSCVCAAPLVLSVAGDSCISADSVLCDALGGTETYASGPGNIAPGASSCNATGCMTTFANTLIRVRNAQGQYITEGAATFTGGTCTYSETTGTAEDTCPGGASGQVNGVTVCVPYDGTENTIETVGESESTSTEGETTTNTSTTSTTTCSNGKCTTTTATITGVSGGQSSTKTTTTTEPQDEFCKRNPTATQCKENGSFTGNCNSSFVCKGDAIQCATAKAANESLCKFKDMLEMDTATRALVDSVLAGTWEKNPKDEPRNENLGSFDQSNPLSGGCPGDIAISIATVSVVIPLGSFCPQLQMMGNLLVAFTLLSATVFVFRGTA